MNELLSEVNEKFCKECCNKYFPGNNKCLCANNHCFYTKEQKISTMHSEKHHLKAWVNEYINQLK